MSALDQIITDALAGSPETHVAILAREVVRLREALAVDLRDDSSGMNEVQRLKAENVRLKIAHLRRMAERADCLRSGWTKMAGLAWVSRRAAALDRFHSACLAKIAELKESQCSTKS